MLGSLPGLFQIRLWLTQEASINCIKNNFKFVERLNACRADAHFRDELVHLSVEQVGLTFRWQQAREWQTETLIHSLVSVPPW